jgi:hypothetical protein
MAVFSFVSRIRGERQDVSVRVAHLGMFTKFYQYDGFCVRVRPHVFCVCTTTGINMSQEEEALNERVR